ncbi:restriction endonuclease subunit S [Lentilactobacillus diolivorans]|uniref:restriction endonuclease subunit S n=1 Tax=Lentilactobacillus diolivorans TaxID=179838 RepID=UPI002468F793|nr:restriction endonuclease subunit S [Lentilactobacillus diolivorans]MDH5106866.1 restriction endonuclease subunit S [Lentilactobacillus diolivorans]
MKDKQAKYPQLRFKGFTDPWVQRNLGDLAEIVRGASPRPIQDPKWFDDSSEIGWLRISDVTEQNGRIHHLDQHISEAGQAKTRVLTEPHLLLSIAATVGKPLVNYVKTGVHDGFLIFMNPKFDLEFMFQWLESYRDKWSRYGQPGSQVNLNSDLVKNQSISIPSMDEQQKLGEFFEKLDNLIAANQRKLDLLKEQKKGYLQKMFPKNGAKVPELRFAGFADAWEQRKLSDGTNKIGDGLHGTPKYSEDGEVYFVNGNNLVNGQIVIMPETKRVTSNEQSKDDKALNESTILMSINGTIGNLAWYRGENLMLGKSAAYIEVSDFDKKFIYAYLQTRPVKDYYLNSLTGTTIKNLGLKAIRNTNICTPTIDEQAKIGVLFQNLDKTITLHQRKLDLLKEQKKGFLQNMFV